MKLNDKGEIDWRWESRVRQADALWDIKVTCTSCAVIDPTEADWEFPYDVRDEAEPSKTLNEEGYLVNNDVWFCSSCYETYLAVKNTIPT